MRLALAALVVAADIAFFLLMLRSVLSPEKRIWPLDRSAGVSSAAVINWTLSTVMLAGVPVLAWLDRGTLGFGAPLAGLAIVLFGAGLTAAGVLRLGVKTSSGYTDELHTSGIYRYTRNPQVVGDILAMLGIAMLADSALALAAALAGTAVHILYPLAEEPWLADEYDGYDAYRAEVPRFVGLRTFRRLWSDISRKN